MGGYRCPGLTTMRMGIMSMNHALTVMIDSRQLYEYEHFTVSIDNLSYRSGTSPALVHF